MLKIYFPSALDRPCVFVESLVIFTPGNNVLVEPSLTVPVMIPLEDCADTVVAVNEQSKSRNDTIYTKLR